MGWDADEENTARTTPTRARLVHERAPSCLVSSVVPVLLGMACFSRPSGQKMLKYIADVIVNGPDPSLGAVGGEPSLVDPTIPNLDPAVDLPKKTAPSLRDIYVKVSLDFFRRHCTALHA